MHAEHAYESMPKNTDPMEDILGPKNFFCAAAAAFSEVLPPMPPTQLAAARAAVLSGMMLNKIAAMLVPAYGADAGVLWLNIESTVDAWLYSQTSRRAGRCFETQNI